MTLSEKQINTLIEAGLTEEEAIERAAQVELLNESESRDGFKFWANYGKARLYWNSKSNRNRGGHVDLVAGTIQADKPATYSTLHRINENANFEVK